MNVHNTHVSVHVMFVHCSFVCFYMMRPESTSSSSSVLSLVVYSATSNDVVSFNVFFKGAAAPRIYNIIYWS